MARSIAIVVSDDLDGSHLFIKMIKVLRRRRTAVCGQIQSDHPAATSWLEMTPEAHLPRQSAPR